MLSEPIEGLETLGCADRNCPFTKHLGGMRTNGGCKCLFEAVRDVQDRRDIQRLIQWKDDEIARLRAENEKIRAARLRPETVEIVRRALDFYYGKSMELPPAFRGGDYDEVPVALADLDRCYTPEEE